MKGKKWCIMSLAMLLGVLIILGGITVFIDPFFHYHKPLSFMAYELSDPEQRNFNTGRQRQRYINDGISKHFDYDAMITGTSMTENAGASLVEKEFGAKRCVKIPYQGGSYKEVDMNLRRAIEANPDLKLVFRSVDYYGMDYDKDDMIFDESYFPTYLYDKNIFNDTSYVFNKTVLFEDTLPTIGYTLKGETTTDFDDYSRHTPAEFGPEQVFKSYGRDGGVNEKQAILPDETRQRIVDNINQNVVRTIEENPQIQFYLYITPCNVCHWDVMHNRGYVGYCTEVEKTVAQLLLGHDNVRLFCFDTVEDIITDLDSYSDIAHFNSAISDRLYEYMARGEYELTEENYEAWFAAEKDYFMNFDYDGFFRPYGK